MDNAIIENCKKLRFNPEHLPTFGEDSIDIQGFTLRLERDDDAESTRTAWDNCGTMLCWHSGYKLGDEQAKYGGEAALVSLINDVIPGFEDRYHESPESENWSHKVTRAMDKYFIWLPLYLYDHSGLTMKTSPFSCRWDSGQVGIIYMSKADARKEWGWPKLNKQRTEKVTRVLQSEVESYDDYLTGNVYGYVLEDPEGKAVDSCWGYYGGHLQSGIYDSLGHIVSEQQRRKKSAFKKTKAWIANRVPLLKRQQLAKELPLLV